MHESTTRKVLRRAGLAIATVTLATSAHAAGAPQVSQTSMVVEHVTITSAKPYADAKKNLEGRLGRLDEPIRELLRAKKVDELQAALQKVAGKDGLVIHYVGVHGDWLVLKGEPKEVTEYFIGNILSAVELTSVSFAAGLYAPLRIVLYATPDGGSAIEYDRPSTQLSQYHSPRIDAVARSLDERLMKLALSVED